MVLIINHFQRAISLLASQFQFEKEDGSLTNLQKIIKSITSELQILDLVNYQLKTNRWLDSASGKQLDELGEILGLPRNPGESDEDYRERLQFQIFINTSNGTPEEMIEILRFLTDASYIGYFERECAFYQMETNGLKFPNPPNDLNDAMFRVSPAGVNYVPIVATYNVPISFNLSGDLSDDLLYLNRQSTTNENLKVETYDKLVHVSIGSVFQDGIGGLDELGTPLASAGQLSELIQKSGNFIAKRFE